LFASLMWQGDALFATFLWQGDALFATFLWQTKRPRAMAVSWSATVKNVANKASPCRINKKKQYPLNKEYCF